MVQSKVHYKATPDPKREIQMLHAFTTKESADHYLKRPMSTSNIADALGWSLPAVPNLDL